MGPYGDVGKFWKDCLGERCLSSHVETRDRSKWRIDGDLKNSGLKRIKDVQV